MFIDVKKAHLNGVVKPDERAYVKMPDDPEGTCRRLKKWLYGMRPAANAWEGEFTQTLSEMGFRPGRACPVVFWNPQTDTRCVVHGDDFTFLGFEDELETVKKDMQKVYSIVCRGVVGPGPQDQSTIVILNRILTWSEGGSAMKRTPSMRRRS